MQRVRRTRTDDGARHAPRPRASARRSIRSRRRSRRGRWRSSLRESCASARVARSITIAASREVRVACGKASGCRPKRPPQGRPREGHRPSPLHRRPPLRQRPVRAHDPIDRAGRRDRDIRYDFDRDGFTIVDHRDIPGRNVVALIDDDQPCLAETRGASRRRADPAARAQRSRRVCSPRTWRSTTARPAAELRSGAFGAVVQDDRHRQGRVWTRAWRTRTSIVEGEYRAGHQEQLYIEPNGVVAVPENGGVTLYGSLQCPVLRASRADGAARSARRRRSASSRPKPAAASAARKSTRR